MSKHEKNIETPAASETETRNDLSGEAFPVIGIGASAGGLEALKAFFAKVSEKSGMAYVVVVHMMANQPSLMPELLQRAAKIPAAAARDGQRLRSDHIYVVPPGKQINLYKDTIQLFDILNKEGTPPIDSFFRSLALDQQANAAGIILSGTGTDGTLGVREIKAHDGLVLVQSEATAKYGGMPGSAVGSGAVDMILPPEEMPEKLIRYFGHHGVAQAQMTSHPDDDREGRLEWLNKIFFTAPYAHRP